MAMISLRAAQKGVADIHSNNSHSQDEDSHANWDKLVIACKLTPAQRCFQHSGWTSLVAEWDGQQRLTVSVWGAACLLRLKVNVLSHSSLVYPALAAEQAVIRIELSNSLLLRRLGGQSKDFA